MTPTNSITVKVQDSVFDLTSFDDVTLYKEFQYTPVTSAEEALARLGNDTDRLLKVINDGLIAEQKQVERANGEGWIALDDEGKPAGPFAGVRANGKAVGALVLTLAKSIFGFNKDMNKDQKRAAKESAMNFIRSNDQIRAGLQKSAAAGDNGDE
jgi:hypothetical protein